MPFGKKTLFVAPETDLYYVSKEAESVVNILHANLLNGKVCIDDLVDRVRRIQPNLLIISTHGNQNGIVLSDGIVGADLLKPILGTGDIECVYLNTCDSLNTAIAIHNELPVAFISMIQAVPDITAYVTMTAFAHHLDDGSTYQQAWYKSKPSGDSSVIFLPNIIKARNGRKKTDRTEFIMPNPMVPGPRDSNGNISNLSDEVKNLSIIIYGDEKLRYPGMLATITKIERRINQILILTILFIVLLSLVIVYILTRGLLI